MASKTLPRLDIKTGIVDSPHVVILGAGASRACCPNGDKQGRKLPVMADFIPALGLEDLAIKFGYDPTANFEAVYSNAYGKKESGFLEAAETKVRDHFSTLQLPDAPTIYDYLVLSLRPKDLIVSFNWDPLLPQAFKRWRHLGEILPRIVFLHGNVDVEVNPDKRLCRFASDHVGKKDGFSPSKLLFPIEKKDYASDAFIQNEWDVCTDYLKHAYCVTIFRYSAPQTDIEARSLLLTAWQENKTATLSEFSMIDIRPEDDVKAAWKEFGTDTFSVWVTDSFSKTRLQTYPRRTCEGLAHATLQQNPWQEDPFPQAKTLIDLEKWISPILKEEQSGKLVGKRHH